MNSVIHKRVFTPLRDVPARIIETIDYFFQLNNGIIDLQKCLGAFVSQYAIGVFVIDM